MWNASRVDTQQIVTPRCHLEQKLPATGTARIQIDEGRDVFEPGMLHKSRRAQKSELLSSVEVKNDRILMDAANSERADNLECRGHVQCVVACPGALDAGIVM